MFKQSVVILGRRTKDCLCSHVVRPNFLVRSYHLANFKNAGIQDQRLGRRNDSPKKLEDGSVGVIHVQGQESATLANPMQRKFLNDLELQQNRWLKEEKKNQDDLGSLTKQITMSAGGGDKCKGGKDADKKKKEEAEKKKCAEMEQKKKCAEAAKKAEEEKKKAEADKKKKEQETAKKCKEMAEKEKCNKMAAEAKKKEEAEKKKKAEEKKKKEQEKKCKEMAEKEKCKKMADAEKSKKGGDKPKK
ncbi:hypothetical protein KR200_003499 [Drosophila serrata]|nr:hypothetical protein KR200_003499 [Drosophila serrata]